MSRLYINDYINNLQQQIYSSVAKIKDQSSFEAPSKGKEEADWGRFYEGQVKSYSYRLLPEEISWQLQSNTEIEASGNAYAAASYRQAGEVLQEPTVLIDFMFKNNQEFDFKV